MKSLKRIAILALTAILTLPLMAVTKEEMEEARTITARLYLRWANNGSGYLDEVNAKTMTQLTAKLKPTEKENLKAFNAVNVPTDYASWDKAKLVEYWSSTFFKSSGLNQDGARAKGRVKTALNAMNVSAPAKEAPKPEAAPAEPVVPPVEEGVASLPSDTALPPEAIDTALTNTEADLLSDQNDIAKAEEEAAEATRPREESHTWVYVVVLAILVAVVIWLVIYAANLMKRQSNPATDDDEDFESDNAREEVRRAVARKEEEINELRRRLQNEEGKSATLGMELEKLKLERTRLEGQVESLREELHAAQSAASAAAAAPLREPVREPRREPQTERQPKKETVSDSEQKPILKVIYLGRANNRGIFVRADRRINAGNTIYRLDTNDGLVGTFHVVDEPEVVDVALTNPDEYLGNGCVADDLNDTAGVTRIITESAGTAIFENGYWKILRKTRIRYE